MNKRITSLLLCFVMVFTMLAAAVPALAAGSTSFNIKPDKTEAHPGDTISYTISLGAVTNLRSIKIKLSIPEGLTYVAGSGKTPDGLEATLNNAQKAAFTESTKVFIVATAAGYTSTTDTLLMEFKCTVNEGASGNKAIDLIIDPDDIFDTDYDNIGYVVNSPAVNITAPHTHVYDQTNTDAAHLKTPATCTEAAVYYKSCTCGENGTETFTSGSALGHDYTQKFEDAAHLKTAASNCTEHNIYWFDCSRCDSNAKNDPEAADKYFSSATTGSHSFTEEIADEAHYVAGTGTDCRSVKKYYYDCAYCDQIGTATWDSTTYGPHSYAAVWSSDADGHWHECSLCHDKKDEAPHTPGAAATETTPQKCTECDYTITPALGHTHSMTPVAANPATCTTDGNKAYYVCSGCSKWYADAAGNEEITDRSSVVIGHLGHDFAPATCTTPKTCKRDGCDATEGIALGHDWKDATCTAPKTCQRDGCGATEGEPNGHTEGTDWKNDANYHWHICSVDGCGAVIESSKAAHTPDHTGHATEEYAIKCSVCDYVIEAQLAPRTPVVNIAATVTAPALGQTPDYAPVIVANPADSVCLEEVYWYKIAIAAFTGTDEDVWDKMEADEVFEDGYYYSVDLYFSTEDGYKITETTTGTVNGMPHDDTYGGVYDGDSDAYLSGLFEPLELEYTIDLPVSLFVKLTGDKKPGKETFKFEIYDLGYEDAAFEIVNDTVVLENLEFDENGVAFADGIIKIKVTGEEQLFNLTEGFKVRMVKGTAKGWTYASEQWYVMPIIFEGTTDAAFYFGYDVREIVDGEISEIPANGMSFTLGYEAVTEPGTPQTGDNSVMGLWIALLVVSGAGATAIYSRKRKSSAE